MPQISLMVIARDEAALVGDCLASARGLADEVVLLDTGSRDATPQIAAALGARVIPWTWCEDFAAARNAALEHVRGDWVLLLDADERLADGARSVIRKAVEVGGFDCGLLPLHNASAVDAEFDSVLAGHARIGEPVLLARLVRRTPDLRWEGLVHESLTSWLRAQPRVLRVLGRAPIIHLGYAPSLTESRGKLERNLLLLRRQCAQTPDDPVPRAYLARELMRLGDRPAARREAETGWERMWADGNFICLATLATLRAHLQLGRGDLEGLLETVERAVTQGCDHPNLYFLSGVAAEQQAIDRPRQRGAHIDTARFFYRRALQHRGRSFSEELIPGATSWAATTRLATVELLAGQTVVAGGLYQAVLATRPRSTNARVGLAEALLMEGQLATCLQLLMEDVEGGGPLADCPDTWVIAAGASEAMGDTENMRAFLQRTFDLQKQGRTLAPHRVERFRALAQTMSLMQGRPQPGRGPLGTLCTLLARAPFPEGKEAGPEHPTDPALVAEVIGHLVTAERLDLLRALREPRAEQACPGLPAVLERQLDACGLALSPRRDREFVFIGGAVRSGTSLLAARLSLHPRLHCAPDLKLVPVLGRAHRQWTERFTDSALSGPVLDTAVRAFLETMIEGVCGEPLQRGLRVVDQTPHSLIHLALLGRLFPQARFVHVIRDGRSVAASVLNRAWREPGTGQPAWFCGDPAGAARYWRDVVLAIREQAGTVKERVLEIRYEALVNTPVKAMSQVLAFLGESWVPEVAGELGYPPGADSAPDYWAKMPREQVAGFLTEGGKMLKALGYG